MEGYRCMNHPETMAVAQCTRCGKPVCDECYNPETGRCRIRCGEMTAPGSAGVPPHRNVVMNVIVSILAILGGLLVLLLAICGTILFSS